MRAILAIARTRVGGRLTVRTPHLAVPTRFQDGLPATPAEPSDHVVCPPRERGIMCSNVSAEAANALPQYWHVKRSRRNTLKRVMATRRAERRYLRSATTNGSRICVDGLRAHMSYPA